MRSHDTPYYRLLEVLKSAGRVKELAEVVKEHHFTSVELLAWVDYTTGIAEAIANREKGKQ
jgi:hypothetical protein